MIRTKSIYKPRDPADGIRILITRYYPRGVKKTHFDRWVRELAPNAELLRKHKNQNITWDEFMISYKSELKKNPESLQTIRELHSNHDTITLLCYEPEGAHCHRHLLKEIINDSNMLNVDFMPEYTDNHKGGSMKSHIAYKEANIIP